MNPYLEKLLNGCGDIQQYSFSAVPCHYNSLGLSKSITWEVGLFLKNFVERRRPRQIVELGTFRGYSTSWLIVGTLLNEFGRVDTYDVQPEGHWGPQWYDFYGLPKELFKFHHIPGGIWEEENARQLPDEIDLIFHDSSHELEDTKKEMKVLLPRIPAGGIALFDDLLYPDYARMAGYLYSLFGSMPNWKFTVVPIGTGLGIAERLI